MRALRKTIQDTEEFNKKTEILKEEPTRNLGMKLNQSNKNSLKPRK
jgi:hypothetical protein